MDILLPFRAAWAFLVQAVVGMHAALGTTMTVFIAIAILIGVIALVAGRKGKFEKQVDEAGESPGGPVQCDRALGECGLRQQD